MPRIIHTKGRGRDKQIPEYNKTIAKEYISQGINLVDRFNTLERNKLWVKKIVTHGIDDGVVLYADIDKLKRLEKKQATMSEFLTPDVKKGHKYWNKGAGLNPFLAMYMYQNRKWVIKTPSQLVKRLVNI